MNVAAGLALCSLLFQLAPTQDTKALAALAVERKASPAERTAAFGKLILLDPERGFAVSASLLQDPVPEIRFAAASQRAKGGDANGERTLIEMLETEGLSPGIRGMAAVALARSGSKTGHEVIVRVARHEAARLENPGDHREGLQHELLRALGIYGHGEDIGVVLLLFKQTGLRGPARPVGLLGRREALTLLHDSLPLQPTAATSISVQLAIARSGGQDGSAFVRDLLRSAAPLRELPRQPDPGRPDPASPRYANSVLDDLGAHPSDRVYFDEVFTIATTAHHPFSGTAWKALGRLGTRGHEKEIVLVASQLGGQNADRALQVLAYNGATDAARELGHKAGMDQSAERYLDAHAHGRDRNWFPVPDDSLD